MSGVKMRRVGDILQELGFNKEASLETQKAFLRHLVQAADKSLLSAATLQAPDVLEKQNKNDQVIKSEQQLCFSFMQEVPAEELTKKKTKAS